MKCSNENKFGIILTIGLIFTTLLIWYITMNYYFGWLERLIILHVFLLTAGVIISLIGLYMTSEAEK